MNTSGRNATSIRWPLAACVLLAATQLFAEDDLNLALKRSDALSIGPSTGVAPTRATPSPVTPSPVLPAAGPLSIKDYRIGPEDLLEIQVFGVDQLSRTVRVNSRGFISLPLIGPIEVAGMTAQEAEASIAAKLGANYLQDPQVSLFIKEFTSQRITIEGAVNKPGIYPLRGQTTLLQSLALAGGQASLSDMSEVMLFRTDVNGKRSAVAYDVERIRSGELDDPAVVNEDLIVIKRSRGRTFLKDSIFKDFLEAINPFK
jgi:polysaccharide biosynthesis/export protein